MNKIIYNLLTLFIVISLFIMFSNCQAGAFNIYDENEESSDSSAKPILITEDFSSDPTTDGWTILLGDSTNWDFTNGDASVDENDIYALCNDTIIWGNYTMSVDITPGDYDFDFGFLLNYEDTYQENLDINLFAGYSVTIRPNIDKIFISGNWGVWISDLTSCDFDFTSGSTYNLKVIYNSVKNLISVKVDGVTYITNYYLVLNDGRMGLFTAYCAGIFDNFSLIYYN